MPPTQRMTDDSLRVRQLSHYQFTWTAGKAAESGCSLRRPSLTPTAPTATGGCTPSWPGGMSLHARARPRPDARWAWSPVSRGPGGTT